MTSSDWIALAGLALTALISAAGVYGVLSGRISRAVAKLHEKIEEVKRDYVRNDHMAQHLGYLKEDVNRIERGQENMGIEMKRGTEALGNKIDGVKDDINKSLVPALVKVAEAAFAAGSKKE